MKQFIIHYPNKGGETNTYHLEGQESVEVEVRKIARQELLPATQASMMIALCMVFLAFVSFVTLNIPGLLVSAISLSLIWTGYSIKRMRVLSEVKHQVNLQIEAQSEEMQEGNAYFTQTEEAWNLKEKEGALLKRAREEYSDFRKSMGTYDSKLLTAQEKELFKETEVLLKQKLENQKLIYEFVESWYKKLKILEANQKANRFIQEYDYTRENLAMGETMEQIGEKDLYNQQILEMKQLKDLILNKLNADNEEEILSKIKTLLEK